MAVRRAHLDISGTLEDLNREDGVLTNFKVMDDGQRSPGFAVVT